MSLWLKWTLTLLAGGVMYLPAAAAQNRITCESRDNQPAYCEAETRGGVQLARQLSSAPCREGDTWGYDRRGIWVDRGCRAEFQLRSGWQSGQPELITCASESHRRQFCPADTRGGVRLVRQFSSAACRQGSTWGYDSRGIWVDRGCRAEFEVRSSFGWGVAGSGGVQTIRCESNDRRRKVCSADLGNASVRLARQLSDTACVQGRTWGHDSRSIWVDRGCRADFEVTYRAARSTGRPGRGRDRGRDPVSERQWNAAERACAEEVAARMRVSTSQVDTYDTTQRPGTQLIEWRIPSGASGYCRVNPNGRILHFKVD